MLYLKYIFLGNLYKNQIKNQIKRTRHVYNTTPLNEV